MSKGEWSSVLLHTEDWKAAAEEIASKGGALSVKVSPTTFIASVPDTLDVGALTVSSWGEATQAWLDAASGIIQEAWETVKEKKITTISRPLPLSMKGSIAIALLIVSGEAEEHSLSSSEIGELIVPSVIQGLQSLALSYPSSKLTFSIEPSLITLSPSFQVPRVGITAWPAPIPFQGKLYCFYQGDKFNLKRLMYNAFDPASGTWGAITKIPDTVATEGPSAVVYGDKLYVFHQGLENRWDVWYNVFDGKSWVGDKQIWNTRMTGGPSVVVFNDKIYCFHQGWTGEDNELWYNVFDGNEWAGDVLVHNTKMTASPSAVVFKDKIYVFYQGINEKEKTLLVNRFDPLTTEWSGNVEVPYTHPTVNGPSALVFENKIYLFHQVGNNGDIWFNTSSDGSLWRGDAPLLDIRVVGGIGTTVFEDELYCFYQNKTASLMYRPFAKGGLEWESVWADPALMDLGFTGGYGGFAELAESVKVKHSADHGYVACFTKLPLLYDAYADGTRLCIRVPKDDLSTTFAKTFGSSGIYDQSDYPSSQPRYTFAYDGATESVIPVSDYATSFMFHEGLVKDYTDKELWFSFLDRRSGKWAEMQGPATKNSTFGSSSVFFAESKIYIFYTVSENGGELYYNVLDQSKWTGEKKVPSTGSTSSPGAVCYNDKIYCFHHGANNNGELWFNVLDLASESWHVDERLPLKADIWEEDQQVHDTFLVLGPSAVVYKDKVYCFYQGLVKHSNNGRLRFNMYDGKVWAGDKAVTNTYLTGEPSAVVYDDKIYVFHQGGKADGTVWYNVYDGVGWAGDKQMGLRSKFLISDGPSTMVLEGKLYCFFRGKGDLANKVWYDVLDGPNGTWSGQNILATGSGMGTQPNALPTGSHCILYDTTPPIVKREI